MVNLFTSHKAEELEVEGRKPGILKNVKPHPSGHWQELCVTVLEIGVPEDITGLVGDGSGPKYDPTIEVRVNYAFTG